MLEPRPLPMTLAEAPRTKDELEKLIRSGAEESTTLEYKAAAALSKADSKRRAEISKDVAAIANSAGGVLIYGVRETAGQDGRRLPERIDPVDGGDITREWLDQMIGQIQPRVTGLEIIQIHVGPGSAGTCYVVAVPQSTTAHQSTDGRYYRRRNFEVTWMEDYEIRDVMNRLKHPSLTIVVRVFSGDGGQPRLVLRVTNESDVMARHFAVNVKFPVRIARGLVRAENAYLESEGDASYWAFTESDILHPLFPRSTVSLKRTFEWVKAFNPPMEKTIDAIHLRAFADNMPPLELTKKLGAAEADWT